MRMGWTLREYDAGYRRMRRVGIRRVCRHVFFSSAPNPPSPSYSSGPQARDMGLATLAQAARESGESDCARGVIKYPHKYVHIITYDVLWSQAIAWLRKICPAFFSRVRCEGGAFLPVEDYPASPYPVLRARRPADSEGRFAPWRMGRKKR